MVTVNNKILKPNARERTYGSRPRPAIAGMMALANNPKTSDECKKKLNTIQYESAAAFNGFDLKQLTQDQDDFYRDLFQKNSVMENELEGLLSYIAYLPRRNMFGEFPEISRVLYQIQHAIDEGYIPCNTLIVELKEALEEGQCTLDKIDTILSRVDWYVMQQKLLQD